MTQSVSDVYRYIVRELAPSVHKPDVAALSIVCELINVPGEPSAGGTITLHLHDGTTPEEAQAMASTLQAKVKALCHVQSDESTAV
ncbi:hypothetical protein OU997_14985 [Pseudomonas sp. SL4(2022)]|uniref:hypothetical protein n=1 Tax=Pseudomonas sp. SL4(2022) TaxID=2994661 RepID=UPI00226F977A|nr:hypothetical protein [Pseudomonas sp. SL4(2022)]WAC43561.1 hypothetical protein OU997_14985 [Pseudomonas sp. SL4(2022)]